MRAAKGSKYHECLEAANDFTSEELKWLRFLLRRLRFLETQIREADKGAANSESGRFVVLEQASLAWILYEVGYLDEPKQIKRRERA